MANGAYEQFMMDLDAFITTHSLIPAWLLMTFHMRNMMINAHEMA